MLKKQKLNGYILLESLVALGLLVGIVGLVCGELTSYRHKIAEKNHQQEALIVANMAIQTNQDTLTLNGVSVRVVRKAENVYIYEKDKAIFYLEAD